MATYEGQGYPSVWGLNSLGAGLIPLPAPDTGAQAALVATTSQTCQSRTVVIPLIFPGNSFGGVYSQTFSYVYYNRIYLFPNPLDFGPILTTTVRELEVWNAFFVSQTLNTFVPANLDGVQANPTLPFTFNPLQAIKVPITATLDGPPDINGTYTLGFTGLGPEVARILGTRSFIVAFRHNWDNKPVERWAWLSNVQGALTGKEQRIRLRQNPRRTVELSYLLSDARSRAIFRAQFWFGQPYQFAVPMWQDAALLTGAVAIGANSLPVDTLGRDFDQTKSLLLWRSPTRFESLTVQSLTGSNITLAGLTALDWRVGDYVVPVRRCVLLQEPVYDEITKTVVKSTIVWAMAPEEVSTWRIASPSFPAYRGLNVLTQDSEASEDLPEKVQRNISVIDNQTGIITRITVDDRPKPVFDYRRILKSRQEFMDFLGFLYQLGGSIMPVWVPTYAHDFQLAQDLQAADVSVKVQDWDYRKFYNLAASRRDIAIITKAGQIIIRRINSVIQSANSTETLTLDAAIGQALTIAQVDRICFVRCCRLASDEAQVEFETDTVMTTTVKFQELTTTP